MRFRSFGAPDENDNANNRADSGAVFIRYGSARGLTATGYHHITAATRDLWHGTNPTEAGERFGACLAAGRLHSTVDGTVDDLVVGAPGKDVLIYSASAGFRNVVHVNAGQVYVYEGRIRYHQLRHRADVIPSTWPAGITGFGSSLAIGDFNGDGHDDLAAGAPNAGEDNSAFMPSPSTQTTCSRSSSSPIARGLISRSRQAWQSRRPKLEELCQPRVAHRHIMG